MSKTIENLKKLKSFHNGSYGADIDKAIKALEQQSIAEERLKMLMETGEFDFLKDITPDKIWKLVFMLKFIGDTENEEN